MIHPLRTPSQVMEVSTDYGVSASRACAQQLPRSSTTLTARSIIIGELRIFFARRGLNGCLGRLGHACRVLLGRGNHLHNPDLVGTKGIIVL